MKRPKSSAPPTSAANGAEAPAGTSPKSTPAGEPLEERVGALERTMITVLKAIKRMQNEQRKP